MLRRVIIALVVFFCIAGSVYLFYQFQLNNRPQKDVYKTIMPDVALVFDTKKTLEIMEQLFNTNIIWEELQATQTIELLDDQLRFLNGMIAKSEWMGEMFNNRSFVISIYPNGKDPFSTIISMALPAGIRESVVLNFPNKILSGTGTSKKVLHGNVLITQIDYPGVLDGQFYFTSFDGYFIGSFDIEKLKECIAYTQSHNHIGHDPAFRKVQLTAGKDVDANIFIQYKQLPELLHPYIKDEFSSTVGYLKVFTQWLAVDLNLKPSSIALNGFSFSNDTLLNYMNLFQYQSPQEIEVAKILPNNTAFFTFFGFSNFDAFRKSWYDYLSKHGDLNVVKKDIDGLNHKITSDIESDVFGWLNNELALVITEPDGLDFKPNVYAVMKCRNKIEALESLKTLQKKANKTGEANNQTLLLGEFEMGQIDIPDLFEKLLGPFFSGVKYNYFTMVEDYVVFANGEASLQKFVQSYKREKTLEKESNYQMYAENLSSKANVFLYTNIARSPNIFQAFLKEEYGQDVKKYIELYRKFEGLGLQMSNEGNDLMYNNLYLKYNPVYKKEFSSLWELKLDTLSQMKPFLHKNHYNSSREVFVQDKNNKIYLISPTGRTLWKRNLGEEILGEVYQVDALNNGKLQLLFLTKTKIYLIDRNGENVFNYPVALKANATQGVNLFDYDHDHNYRLLITTENNAIYNYDITGEIVKGWDFNDSKAPFTRPLQHIAVKGKDYIIAVNSNGKVFALDRKGKKRLRINNKVAISDKNAFYLVEGSDISGSYLLFTDSSGNINRLYLDDHLEQLNLPSLQGQHQFLYKDIDGDGKGDYVVTNGPGLYVYDQSGNVLLNFTVKTQITGQPMVFNLGSGKSRIGFLCSESDEIYLIDQEGTLEDHFPLYGASHFSIGDINKDGTYNLIVTGNDHVLYNYNLNP